MQTIAGYTSLNVIYEGPRSRIYRAKDEKNQSVILKVFIHEYPTPEEINKFYREYDILERFDDEGIIRVCDKFEYRCSPAIAFEDIGGKSLADIFRIKKITIEAFLYLSVCIVEIIGKIHGKDIIHKDINPSNIVWNRETDHVQVIDFGISTELPREITPAKNPRILEGTLAYISPEQTGRMNRPVDYRTDFYSLGATFYWLLTGRVPFDSKNPQTLMYHHLAVLPVPPHEIDNTIPDAISRIVMKLMAKSAEDRYLSSYGLRLDLVRCQEGLLSKGHIETFEPGLQDVSDRFQIPQKIYGRDHEVSLILSSFERARNGNTELMMVSGFSGIGKSVLINEIHKPIVKHSGYFIFGKFERLKKDVPYSGFIQAFTGLARQILTEDEATLNMWKERLIKALGPNGKIITDMIPMFELIIGKQPEMPDLEAIETQNRFNLVLQSFLRIMAGSNHPLVIFLDDLQWADLASLHLLKLFSTDTDINHLFIIGAYRHNEAPKTHPLTLTLEGIQKAGTILNTILLKPLNAEQVKELLNDALNHPLENTASLAELLIQKTEGNPFFINQFLKSLYKEDLIKFSFESGWSWNMAGIEALQATDQVVYFMAEKIKNMSEDIQRILKTGACIGNYFTLTTLATISERSEIKIKPAMNNVLQEGFLILSEEIYRFSHDRILEAAYSLVTDEEKTYLHHRIGMLALLNTAEEALPDKIFYIANHLNAGIGLVTSASEKRTVAELNLMAGKKALDAAAYASALSYLTAGINLLEKSAWRDNYDFTLSLYQEATAAAQLTANYELMENLAETVLQNGKSILDKIRVYQAKILAEMAKNQPFESIRIGLQVLRQLGIRIPEKPGPLRILYELILTKLSLIGKPVENLINLPEMTDPHKLVIMQILSSITPAAYTAAPDLVPCFNFNGIRLMIKYGRSRYAAYFYAIFGLIHCGFLKDIDTGYAWGKLSRNTLEKFDDKVVKSRTLFCLACFINHIKIPMRDIAHEMLEAYNAGLETGDLEFAALSLHFYSLERYLYGDNLADLNRDLFVYKDTLRKLKQYTALGYHEQLHQSILNLLGESDDPSHLKGVAYDVEKMLPKLEEANDRSAVTGVHQVLCMLNYLFGNYAESLKHAELMRDNIDSLIASPLESECYFYDSLVRLTVFSQEKKTTQRKFLRKIRKNQKQIKRTSGHAPANYKHKYHLVEAEIARVHGKNKEAEKHYDLAVKLARQNQYINEEALALYLSAKFHLDLDNEQTASVYMIEAHKAYTTWGALAKTKHIENHYSRLIKLQQGETITSSTKSEDHEYQC